LTIRSPLGRVLDAAKQHIPAGYASWRAATSEQSRRPWHLHDRRTEVHAGNVAALTAGKTAGRISRSRRTG